MKTRTAAALLCLAGVFTTGAVADEQEFQVWMKKTGGTMGKLKKEVDAKAYSDVATDAAALQEIFKNVETYFAKIHTDDAVTMSQSASTAAKQLADAAKAGDADAVAAGFKGVSGSCAGCHKAHRDRLPDGTSKIK